MEVIDQVRINFSEDNLILLNICLAFLLFSVALDIRVSDFKQLFQHPKPAFVGLFSQWLLLPILTFILVWLIEPPVSMALGMILIAACPGGNVSNYASHLAHANVALSVTLTSFVSIAAVVLTPLTFGLWAGLVPGVEHTLKDLFVDPMHMFSTIFKLIVVPLTLGMCFNYYFPEATKKIKKPVTWLGFIVFSGIIVFGILSNINNIWNYLHLVFFVVLIHNALALIMGYNFARLNGLSRKDRRTISIETGIQNSGLGLVLIFNFYDGLGGMAMVAAWWGIWHLFSGFSLAMWWSRRAV